MRAQIDRFEDGEWAVLFVYPDGKRSFDAPMSSLPQGAAVGDVLDVKFERNEEETKKRITENERLMDDLLNRGEE